MSSQNLEKRGVSARALTPGRSPKIPPNSEKPPSAKIIFFAINITNGRWWSYAACSLWRAGYLSNGQPADHVLQGRVPPAHQLRDGVD